MLRLLIAHLAHPGAISSTIAFSTANFASREENGRLRSNERAEKPWCIDELMQDAYLSMEEVVAMGDAIAETAAIIDVATHRFLTQLREFDRVGAWHRTGAVSCAHWLSWRIGMDLATAREKVRVARRLGELPRIDETLRTGEISYSKVRAMTRVATTANEADLLAMAKVATGAQLAKICRLKARVNRLDGPDPRPVEDCRRYVLQHSTEDGMVSIQVRVLPDEAARVMRAFEVFGDGNLADGAVAVAEIALLRAPSTAESAVGNAQEMTAGSETASADDRSVRPRRATRSPARSVRPPVEVVLHVSAADLEGETALGDGVPPAVSRRLLCDCGVVPMLEDERGKTIDVGRKKRTFPSALRRALEARDGGCRFPGCTNRLFTDGHHLIHWIDGGETNLANTVLLCRRHHRYLHEYGFTVERVAEDGGGVDFLFRDPTGTVIPPQGERRPVSAKVDEAVRGWIDRPITAATNAPGWDGLRADYGLCVGALGEDGRPSTEANTW